MDYYDDNDPYCVRWLGNLIAVGHIPAGRIDERSILDVRASDLEGIRQGAQQRESGEGDRWKEQDRGSSAWGVSDVLPCADGKARRVESGTFPLVDGLSFKLAGGGPFQGKSRVGMLRAYGNAIVPQIAAGFVMAYMEARSL